MYDSLSFKETLLAQLNHSHNEADIFAYLDTINNKKHFDFIKLEQYSTKLTKLNDLEWLNVKEKPNWSQMSGKLLLIDFWTYCCINCMHIIPLLNQIENEFPQLCVIGVHSSKFTNEKSKLNIYNAIRRHLIKHPVVCDSDLTIWNDMQIACWPTLLIVDPNGLIIAEFVGETQANLVKQFLRSCFKYYTNQLNSNLNLIHQFEFDQVDSLESAATAAGETQSNKLCFPTKICIDKQNSILFISDSGNNRILGVDLESNEIKLLIGNGRIGLVDSALNESEFNWPQGIEHDPDTNQLFICDTFNNMIRCANLNSNTVSTICGVKINDLGYYDLTGGKLGIEQAISSPWDLCLLNKEKSKILLIACAGTHQIWLYSFENKLITSEIDYRGVTWWRGLKFEWNRLICVAGNGKERNKNNSYPLQASFAQPSGINYDGNESIYLADAESSTIRVISLKDGCVKNVVGGDQFQPDDLFAYGDKDGKGSEARLQHPLDVKYLKQNDKDLLLVVDTYNHSLKLVDLKTKICQKLKLSNSNLNEPNSLLINQESVYICDTNNHSIKLIRKFESNKTEFDLEEFKLKSNLSQLVEKKLSLNSINFIQNAILLDLKSVELNFDAQNTWKLELKLKNGSKHEYNGNIMNENKLGKTNLFKLIDLVKLDDLKRLELSLCLYYCESTKQSGKICKLNKKCIKFTGDDLLKQQQNTSNESNVVLEVSI